MEDIFSLKSVVFGLHLCFGIVSKGVTLDGIKEIGRHVRAFNDSSLRVGTDPERTRLRVSFYFLAHLEDYDYIRMKLELINSQL